MGMCPSAGLLCATGALFVSALTAGEAMHYLTCDCTWRIGGLSCICIAGARHCLHPPRESQRQRYKNKDTVVARRVTIIRTLELEVVAADMKVDVLSQGRAQWLREPAAARTWEHR
mgnify:CR=1 FL=1